MDYLPRWIGIVWVALLIGACIGLWEAGKYVWRRTHVTFSAHVEREPEVSK